MGLLKGTISLQRASKDLIIDNNSWYKYLSTIKSLWLYLEKFLKLTTEEEYTIYFVWSTLLGLSLHVVVMGVL